MNLLRLFVLTHCFVFIAAFYCSSQEIKPLVIGKQIDFKSEILDENRLLNVYLPDGYHPDSLKKYPVMYVLDGSLHEDFLHIAGIVQYQSYPWINATPASIVVGISNVDRKRDFTFPTSIEKDKQDFPTTGGSQKFIQFIEEELQPLIATTFHVSEQKTIVGQSLGGLLASEILLTKPELFTHYLIVSPSIWWDNQSLLNKIPNLPPTISVHIAVGKEGKVMKKDAQKLYQLIKKNASEKSFISFEFFKEFDHADILHQAVFNGFQKLYSVTKNDYL